MNSINSENNKKENRKSLLLAVIMVGLFIAVSVGSTFAFYLATMKGNNENGDVTIKTAQVYAVFNAKNYIEDVDVYPGYSNQLEFNIINTSSTSDAYGNYSLVWEIEKNELDDDSFVYTLVGETIVDGKVVESNSISHNNLVNISETRVPKTSTVLGTGLINTGVTHNYILTIKFKETGENQNELQAKEFKSYIIAKGEPVVE